MSSLRGYRSVLSAVFRFHLLSLSRPPALDSVSSSLPGSQLAQASCLAPLQRFPSAAGFSSAIAEQSSLARCPSSRAVYQVHGPFIMGGVTPMAIPFLILP